MSIILIGGIYSLSRNDKITIVMATYQQAHFLRTALLSCFNQTYPNYEVVVVSVDGDRETDVILGDFPFPFKWIISEKADYVYQRNLGVKGSDGEWYCFADSDDFLLPVKLETDMEVAKSQNALLVYSSFLIADEQLRVVKGLIPPEFSRKLLLQSCIITDFSLVNRKLYDEFGPYDEKLGEVAFYDFYLKIAEKYPDKIKLNKTPTFIYRRYKAQMSQELSWDVKIKMRKKVQQASLARKPLK